MDRVQSTKFINHRILEIYDARWRQTLSLYNFEKYYMQSSKGVMLGFNTNSRQHQPPQHTMENSIAAKTQQQYQQYPEVMISCFHPQLTSV